MAHDDLMTGCHLTPLNAFNLTMSRRGVVVSALVSINEVALHRARLLLGWVTVYRQVIHQVPRSAQASIPLK